MHKQDQLQHRNVDTTSHLVTAWPQAPGSTYNNQSKVECQANPDCHHGIVPVGLACDLRMCSALTCHLSALIKRMRRWLMSLVSSSTDSADLSIWLSVDTGRRAAAAAAWWPCMAIRTDASWPRAMVSTDPCNSWQCCLAGCTPSRVMTDVNAVLMLATVLDCEEMPQLHAA